MAGELIEHFTDHEGRVSRFIEEFKNKPDLEALARIYLRQIQDIEDAAFEVILERDLDNAIGVQLSTIGKIVKQARTTSDDDRFRTAIRARIAINLSDSTAEDVIKVARLLLQEFGESFELRDEPPAQLRVTIHDPLQSAEADLVHELLGATKAGGVRLVLVWHKSLAAVTNKLLLGSTTGGATTGGGLGSTTGPVTDPGKLMSSIGD
jgi:hypothetical protein